jgi:hypothetical protein
MDSVLEEFALAYLRLVNANVVTIVKTFRELAVMVCTCLNHQALVSVPDDMTTDVYMLTKQVKDYLAGLKKQLSLLFERLQVSYNALLLQLSLTM